MLFCVYQILVEKKSEVFSEDDVIGEMLSFANFTDIPIHELIDKGYTRYEFAKQIEKKIFAGILIRDHSLAYEIIIPSLIQLDRLYMVDLLKKGGEPKTFKLIAMKDPVMIYAE